MMKSRRPIPTWRVVLMTVGIVLASLALLAGVGLGGIALFAHVISDPVPMGPDHPVVFGVRADGDALSVSTGRECPTGTRYYIDFTWSTETTPVRSLWITSSEPVSTFSLPHPGPGFHVDRTYPNDGVTVMFDHDQINIQTFFSSTGSTSYNASIEYTDLVEGSNENPGRYYFGEMGWLTTDEAAARDGVDLLTVCDPMPR